MRHGTRHRIATEPHAKVEVVKVLKQQGHKNVMGTDVGTVIYKKVPYISASPDLKIECRCCGTGLVEIKCPYTIRDVKPTKTNQTQLSITDNIISLKQNNSHFYQIQGQLGILGINHCWYFIFTHQGSK